MRALLPFLLAALTGFAFAHGARITWQTRADSIFINASFDDGTPMDSAQVIVFSGADPMNPWLTSYTDSQGDFGFLPDIDESTSWDVQVRKAGHGDIAHILLDSDQVQLSGGDALSPLQIIIMSVCVVWGFVGTALFFYSRRKRS